MATNACDVNQLDSDSLLPPRKRLLAGFKKQNSRIGNGSLSPPLPCFASSSSTSNSNGSSSSASTDVQTHLDNLLTSHDQTRSPDELAQASKAAAALAVKAAKRARAAANEKALVAAKAVAAAKSALELFASFPVEAVSCKERSPRKSKQKKHVPVQLLYSKGGAADEDLARRLNRAIDSSPRVLRNCYSHRNKKQKSVAATYESSAVTSTMYDGHDVAGVVDSDSSSDDDGVGRSGVNGKLLIRENAVVKEKTGEESSSLGKRRGRVKLKKLPLSMCASKDKENGIITKSPLAEKKVPLAQSEDSNGVVAQVR